MEKYLEIIKKEKASIVSQIIFIIFFLLISLPALLILDSFLSYIIIFIYLLLLIHQLKKLDIINQINEKLLSSDSIWDFLQHLVRMANSIPEYKAMIMGIRKEFWQLKKESESN